MRIDEALYCQIIAFLLKRAMMMHYDFEALLMHFAMLMHCDDYC